MRTRFRAPLIAAALTAAIAVPAYAEPGSWLEPPSNMPQTLPKVARGDRLQNLDFLFGALKAAPDADSAKAVETRIMTLWQASGSDTADLLMSRAKKALNGKDVDLALSYLDLARDRKVTVDPALEEEDAELVWDVKPDGTLVASISVPDVMVASNSKSKDDGHRTRE